MICLLSGVTPRWFKTVRYKARVAGRAEQWKFLFRQGELRAVECSVDVNDASVLHEIDEAAARASRVHV
jgi:hypothetical protein